MDRKEASSSFPFRFYFLLLIRVNFPNLATFHPLGFCLSITNQIGCLLCVSDGAPQNHPSPKIISKAEPRAFQEPFEGRFPNPFPLPLKWAIQMGSLVGSTSIHYGWDNSSNTHSVWGKKGITWIINCWWNLECDALHLGRWLTTQWRLKCEGG